MIRSANHSSFAKVGESPLDQEVRLVLKRHEVGKATDGEVSQVIDEVITIVVAQQSRAFIDIVTDGMVRWDGPLSYLARHVDGLRTAELFRWFDSNFYDRRLVVNGDPRGLPDGVTKLEVKLGTGSRPIMRNRWIPQIETTVDIGT